MAQPSKKEVLADPILRKGHVHQEKRLVPKVCPYCKGSGYFGKNECSHCEGEGVVYEL